MNKDTIIRYVRHPNGRRIIGCVVAVKTDTGVKYGWSQCNPKDTFNRKTARGIAIGRAINGNPDYQPRPIKFNVWTTIEGVSFEAPKPRSIKNFDAFTPVRTMVEAIATKAFAAEAAIQVNLIQPPAPTEG